MQRYVNTFIQIALITLIFLSLHRINYEMTDKEGNNYEARLGNLFKHIQQEDFVSRFSTAEGCLSFLAEEKWKQNYRCRKCGHDNYCQGKTPYSRRCTRCKHEESATAHTLFHHCKINLPDAFKITYMICHDEQVSSHELSRQLQLRQMTCWKFKQKINECLQQKKGIIPGSNAINQQEE